MPSSQIVTSRVFVAWVSLERDKTFLSQANLEEGLTQYCLSCVILLLKLTLKLGVPLDGRSIYLLGKSTPVPGSPSWLGRWWSVRDSGGPGRPGRPRLRECKGTAQSVFTISVRPECSLSWNHHSNPAANQRPSGDQRDLS